MQKIQNWLVKHASFLFVATIVLCIGAGGIVGVDDYGLREQNYILETQASIDHLTYQNLILNLRGKYVDVSEQKDALSSNLDQEHLRNDQFQAQLNGIKGSVDYLQKLSETDKELLQKYSKIYFLNENYIPSSLAVIDQNYTQNKANVYEIHTKVWPYLKNMIDAAEADGVHLRVISSYRSFGEQASLKAVYKLTYGSGANKFSADQGYSEHQLASTIDFTTAELGDNFTTFEKATAFTWLQNNAYKFGFILSYPKGNSYYVFEPWHWRFVGTALAARLQNESKHFYDMDQRDIDKYLALIFD